MTNAYKSWNLVLATAIGGLAIHGAIVACGSVSSRSPDAQAADAPMSIPPGTIVAFAGTNAPEGWLLCDGGLQSRATYAALFGSISTLYGLGDGSTTFNVPDLRGRGVVGTGAGTGLTSRELAQKLGEESHTLSISEMPAHSHQNTSGSRILTYSTGGQAGVAPNAAVNMRVSDNDVGAELSTTGGNQPHNIMQPTLVLHYIIKT